MTPQELIAYYVQLLIIQYASLPRATATVAADVEPILIIQNTQKITFAPTPTSGAFTLSYNAVVSASMNFNATAADVQTALQTIPALAITPAGAVINVQGNMTDGFTVDFSNVIGVVYPLVVASNTLAQGITPTVITITQTDVALPLSVQNAFNIDSNLGPVAVGNQLDIIGKYAGVKRTSLTQIGSVTLKDSDFVTLIKFAIVQNSAGSSLADIEYNMTLYFPGQFLLIDSKNMFITYFVNDTIGSSELFQVLISENYLPKPMAVGLGVFIVPNVQNLFAFRTYTFTNPLAKPFNTYAAGFNPAWKWLSYADRFI